MNRVSDHVVETTLEKAGDRSYLRSYYGPFVEDDSNPSRIRIHLNEGYRTDAVGSITLVVPFMDFQKVAERLCDIYRRADLPPPTLQAIATHLFHLSETVGIQFGDHCDWPTVERVMSHFSDLLEGFTAFGVGLERCYHGS